MSETRRSMKAALRESLSSMKRRRAFRIALSWACAAVAVLGAAATSQLGQLGKLPYEPAKDLTPILLLGLTPMALVAHPGAGIGNVKDLVAAARAAPQPLAYGSCGIGTPQHFAMELVKEKTGIAATHA